MRLTGSRFSAGQCPTYPRCKQPVIWAQERGIRHPFEVDPTPDGIYQLRDNGGDLPMATALSTTQRFGKQGTLHKKHDCQHMRATRRR